MTKRRTKRRTKRAFLVSLLSMMLCVSMLIGSTFAWFTDTASTTVNTIQAGTLDIDIQDNSGNSLAGDTLSFVDDSGVIKEDILWEPGCTYKLQEATLVNRGNLALKFKVEIKGLVGDTELADVIEIKIGNETKGTLADLMVDPDGAAYGYLLPAGSQSGDSASIGQIELHMMESAGNQYQDKTLEGLAIFVSATQYTYETDSYSDQYDAVAEFAPVQADFYVETSEGLIERLRAADYGDIIAAKEGVYTVNVPVETKGTLIVESGEDVDLTLTGGSIKSVKNAQVNAPTVKNYGDLTITGGTINNPNATAEKTNVAAVQNISGTLTLNDCTITNVAPTSLGDYAVCVDGGEVVMNNCIVSGGRGGISVSGSGSVNMTGGRVTAGRYYPLYTRGSGASSFENVTFTKDHTKSKAITYNAFGSDGGTVEFTGCTFNSTSVGASFDISNVTTGFTITNCTFDNVKAPNE